MRPILLLPLLASGLAPGAAHAHAGHLAPLAGHDHWVAGAALGAAALAGLWGLWKGAREAGPAAGPVEVHEEVQAGEAQAGEAPA